MSELGAAAWLKLKSIVAYWTFGNPGRTFGSLLLLSLVLFVLDRRSGRNWRRYFSRTALTDLLYTLFYLFGAYTLLVLIPLHAVLEPFAHRFLPFLEIDLVGSWPVAAQWIVVTVFLDGVQYAQHRLMHASPLLWRFHRVHHSAEHLTPLTKFRFHFVDMAVFSVVKFVPVMLIGSPGEVWLFVNLAPVWLQAVAHADLGIGFGPLERVFVSPRFHRLHHSAEPRHCHCNYGFIFSFWDAWFGTALWSRERPAAYGCPDLNPPESFLRQLAYPFLPERAPKPHPQPSVP